jgi:hypothetical protein
MGQRQNETFDPASDRLFGPPTSIAGAAIATIEGVGRKFAVASVKPTIGKVSSKLGTILRVVRLPGADHSNMALWAFISVLIGISCELSGDRRGLPGTRRNEHARGIIILAHPKEHGGISRRGD